MTNPTKPSDINDLDPEAHAAKREPDEPAVEAKQPSDGPRDPNDVAFMCAPVLDKEGHPDLENWFVGFVGADGQPIMGFPMTRNEVLEFASSILQHAAHS